MNEQEQQLLVMTRRTEYSVMDLDSMLKDSQQKINFLRDALRSEYANYLKLRTSKEQAKAFLDSLNF